MQYSILDPKISKEEEIKTINTVPVIVLEQSADKEFDKGKGKRIKYRIILIIVTPSKMQPKNNQKYTKIIKVNNLEEI